MQPSLTFDIETIPDAALLRQHLEIETDCDDYAVCKIGLQRHFAEKGSFFLAHPFHQIVAISVLYDNHHEVKLLSLGEPEDSEEKILRLFFKAIESYEPQLISFNGGGFDLPVIHYRALKYGIASPTYWDQGRLKNDNKYNHYLGRYHHKHLDLMDFLALYQGRANASLQVLAQLIGLPGKQVLSGDAVMPAFFDGKIIDIRDYCEADVLNTYLLFLRLEQIRGTYKAATLADKYTQVRAMLRDKKPEVFDEFLGYLDR